MGQNLYNAQNGIIDGSNMIQYTTQTCWDA